MARLAAGAPIGRWRLFCYMAKKLTTISDLTTDPANANRGTKRGLGLLDNSLRQYGAGRSILADKNGTIIAGNKTLERAADIGMEVVVVPSDGTKLIVVQRTDLDIDSKQGRELAYADNRVAQVDLDWNPDQLLADVNAGIDLAGLFGKDDLDAILRNAAGYNTPADDPGADMDRAAELQAKWGTALGQLWQIGRHRLLCGDCTVRENVERVMGGEKAGLLWTSPPYPGFDIWRSIWPGMTVEQQQAWVVNVIALGATVSKAINVVVNVADNASNQFNDYAISNGLEQLGLKLWQRFVWHKTGFIPLSGAAGNARLPLNAEAMLWFTSADKPFFNEPLARNRGELIGSVWGAPIDHSDHGASFPIELSVKVIEFMSADGSIVLDPFAGTGTTIVACEQLGRIGRGLELSPAYCAVILERLAGMGLTPELVA